MGAGGKVGYCPDPQIKREPRLTAVLIGSDQLGKNKIGEFLSVLTGVSSPADFEGR